MSKSWDFKSWKTGIQWDMCFPYTFNLRLCKNARMFFKQLDHHHHPANKIAWSKSCSGTMPHWVPWRPTHHLVALVLTHFLHSQEQLHNLHSFVHDSNPDLLVDDEANGRVLDPDIPTTMYPWKKKKLVEKNQNQNPPKFKHFKIPKNTRSTWHDGKLTDLFWGRKKKKTSKIRTNPVDGQHPTSVTMVHTR